jgi:hypothetical protein
MGTYGMWIMKIREKTLQLNITQNKKLDQVTLGIYSMVIQLLKK